MEHHYFLNHIIKENIFLIFSHFTRKLHVNCDRYEYSLIKNLKNKNFMILSLHKVLYTQHMLIINIY